MSFTINTNVASLEAQTYLGQTSTFQQQTIEEVTSGLRIVNSGNDAAGLAVANGYASDEAVLTQGIANANNGIGQLQTVDGGENNISQLLDRASTLATQSASGTFTGSRTTLNNEFQSVLTEINREAQAIGLNQGGSLASNLSVFVGGGQAASAGGSSASAALDGEEQLNLTNATVDAKSLGLTGVQVIGGTAGTTDIGTGSATSVENIVTDTANTGTEAQAGYTNFFINGPGFSSTSGSTQIKLAVNLTGVTDTNTLVAAINSAITAAGGAGNQQATAFANANITASTNTDSTGKTQLTFGSSSSAFQVTGGDQVATALLGNFAVAGNPAGNTAKPTITGAGSVALTGGSGAETVNISFQGAGLASPVSQAVTIAASTSAALNGAAAVTAINTNTTLEAAGITAAYTGGKLVFTGPATQTFSVQASGDLNNTLGLGSYGASGVSLAGGALTTGSQSLQISVNGGLGVNLGSLATGATAATAAAAINAAIQSTTIAGASQLRAAGLTATAVGTVSAGTPATAASLVTGANATELTLTANATGVAGNADTITIVAGTSGVGATLTTASFNGGALTVTLGTGANSSGPSDNTVGDVLDAINLASGAFTASTTGDGTGIVTPASSASLTGGAAVGAATTQTLTLTSSTGADFRLNTYAGAGNFGFGATGTAAALSAGSTQSAYAVGDATQVNAQGENLSSTTTGNTVGEQGQAFTFTNLTDQSDAQTVTLSAIDASGNSHSLNVALNTTNAGTLDQALTTINNALQDSNDSTLQSLVAFKEQTGTATQEGIQFASSSATFTASLGATTNGVGLSDIPAIGQPAQGATTLLSSSVFGTAGTADISNASSAANAVTALTNAVNILGNAQAAVGRGENQFQYAANLAQSQLTNDQAAESQIRDANIAQESANLTKASIQLQAGVAALAQANSAPQQLLTLLQGH
jgi:flagellin